ASLSEEPTWPDLITAELPLVVGNPEQDPATMATLLAAQAGLGDSDAARALHSNLMVKLAQNSVPDPVSAVEEGGEAFAPTTAGRVSASEGTDTELVGLTPRGGAGSLAYPYLVLPGAEEAPGVAELRDALLALEAAAAFEAGGFAAGRSAAPGRGPGRCPDASSLGPWACYATGGADGAGDVAIAPARGLDREVAGETKRKPLRDAVGQGNEDFADAETGLQDTIIAAF